MDPRALDEMFPDWRSQEIPFVTEAKTDRMYFMAENRSVRLPVVPQLRNKGCYIVSLRSDSCVLLMPRYSGALALCAGGWGPKQRRWGWMYFPVSRQRG